MKNCWLKAWNHWVFRHKLPGFDSGIPPPGLGKVNANGEDGFYAFVETSLLPLPFLGELELGKVSGPATQENIVFVSLCDGNDEIYEMNIDEFNQVNVTNNAHHESFFRWSPDGQKISYVTFSSNRNTNLFVFVTRGKFIHYCPSNGKCLIL